jgi:hypothetical protein
VFGYSDDVGGGIGDDVTVNVSSWLQH